MCKPISIQLLHLVAGISRPSIFLLVLTLGSGFHLESEAQEPARNDLVQIDQTARNRQPAFLVRADVNRSTRDYRQGDGLSVRVASEVDAYLYVLYQQADGRIFQIFPNAHQLDNRVPARQTVEIPAKDDAFRWSAGPPFGDEVIKVIASRRPIADLADPALRQDRFNAVSGKQIKGIELELGTEPPNQWAEYDVKIHTYPADQAHASPGARRFGILFGVSDYKFNDQYELASGGRARLNLEGCDRDAREMAGVLREVGQLSELRVYTNGQATRDRLQEAITRWLPAVSRPGDTVVFFFAGHGLQIPDDNGDEADAKDEVIAPYDTVTLDILLQLLQQQEQKKETPASPAEVKRWQEIARAALDRTGSPQQATAALVRETAVTDDLFARWLQALDGRQILVLMDNCHSGGFTTPEKGGETDFVPIVFDFLDREVSRLKDIGQGDIALLAACGAQQSSLTREERDHGVLTFSLLDVLRRARGPVEIRDAYTSCRTLMKQYFETTNRRRQARGKKPLTEHQPVFVTFSSRQLFLKP